jgi:uncharacterized RDD family membrane protein YckC
VAITVLKHNVPWGPFSRAQVRDGLNRGDFTLQYLACAPGLREWLPLGEVLDFYDRHANLPPVPGTDHLPPVPSAAVSLPTVPVTAPIAKPPALPATILPERPSPVPPPISASHATPPSPNPATREKESVALEIRRAPFFPRFIAFAIDVMVLFLPIVFLFGLGAVTIAIQGAVEHADAETMRQEWALLRRNFQDLLLLVALGGAWLYAAGLECSRWQATVGKQWIGLKVVDTHGQRLSFFRATGRHAAKFLSALPCFLGFTMALFSPRGLALHDRLAATRVLRK